jgi:ribose transport system ATP-binding protein
VRYAENYTNKDKNAGSLLIKGMVMPQDIIIFRDVTKRFPGVVALSHINLNIYQGETHILVGENGAGKSSLIKLLCGVYPYDQGTIMYQDKEYMPKTPLDAINAGIRCVYQELNLLSYLSVAENIFFQNMPRRYGLVNFKKMHSDTEKLLAEVGLADISPTTPVERLGIAQMQLIEIAKAISVESQVLILDEPTATLTPPEINRLFAIIRKLHAKGVTIIYISHRLQELQEIGDRITVMRNGQNVGTWPVSQLSIDEIVRQMIGREIRGFKSNYHFNESSPVGQEIFYVKDLQVKGRTEGVSFSVRTGEIFGVFGLVGSGRTEAMRAIFGADPMIKGSISLNGKKLNISSPRDAVKEGICLLTEDRKNQGLILKMNCMENITITDFSQVSSSGYLLKKKEVTLTGDLIKALSIKIESLRQHVVSLSGGNQQKIVLAKWLFRNPKVIILDEPTRGIDIGAKHEIYLLLWELAKAGTAIIFVSSDMPELLSICHRIAVFSKGKLVETVRRQDFSQEKLLSCAYQEYLKSDQQGGVK